MQSETKNCQNCKKDFTIEPDDFSFYEKIKVPPPTFCPECRMQRRISFRNERHLYKRNCDLCGENMIAMYPADATFPVYCNKCWYSDGWDAISFGRFYKEGVPFLKQWHNLLMSIPRPALIGQNNVNCHYINYSIDNKNCYLVVGCGNNQDCAYSYRTFNSKNSYDCFGLMDSSLCRETVQSLKGFKTNYCQNCENSLESTFLLDCKNVSYSLGCINLRNQKYHYFNKPISEEDYKDKKEKLGAYSFLEKLKEGANDLFLKFPRRFARIVLSVNSDGDELTETRNCHYCFFVRKAENLKYAGFCTNMKDSYDFNHADNSELIYESGNIEQNYNKLFSTTSWFSSNISYCDLCVSGQELFGCVGLHSKSYCILNKQYSKEEYEKLKGKIIKEMKSLPYIDSKGLAYFYGEFFPAELSPFAYNESLAQEYFPLNKKEAENFGYRWKDDMERNYKITKETRDLPDHIKNTDDSILNEVIACIHAGKCNHQCTEAFRIINDEFKFYKQENIPLPRLCPNCRHYERLATRNPFKLWHRKCMKEGCSNEFETSYAPERPEIIYCEKCYNQEVY